MGPTIQRADLRHYPDPMTINDDPHQIHAPDLFDKLAPSIAVTSRFSDKINERAWKLLEENFTPTQWEFFNQGKTVELYNKAKTHRLLLNRSGAFMVWKGDAGEGVTLESGAIREGSFPLGDEMKSFIEWFIERTDELLSRWGCSNYTIRPLSSREEARNGVAEMVDHGLTAGPPPRGPMWPGRAPSDGYLGNDEVWMRHAQEEEKMSRWQTLTRDAINRLTRR